MPDRLLDKYLGTHGKGSAGGASPGDDLAGTSFDGESLDDLGCFGWLRGVRDRALMLELRKNDGSIMAVSYGYLERAEFDPTDGITLHVMGRTVRITGRNLNAEIRPNLRLFHGITRYRVPWIQEAGSLDQLGADDKGVVVEGVEW
ncbi:MAG TPA: hypothetical protein VHN77_14660 [Phycisphaerales bacterium]|nr:hypothetical protein [Phycisphaerales bacterium]